MRKCCGAEMADENYVVHIVGVHKAGIPFQCVLEAIDLVGLKVGEESFMEALRRLKREQVTVASEPSDEEKKLMALDYNIKEVLRNNQQPPDGLLETLNRLVNDSVAYRKIKQDIEE